MFEKLEEYIKNNENKIIAIEGPSGAGKSTLSVLLEQSFDVLVIHTDDYFLHPSMKTKSRLNEPGGNIDYERLEQEVFLSLNQPLITSHFFNCQTNELEERQAVKRKSIVIVEGVYALHPKFVDYYDLKVFIDIKRQTQLKRILDRSGAHLYTKFVEEWIPLEDKYFEECKVRNNVDLYFNIS